MTPSKERLSKLRFINTWSSEREISVTRRARSTGESKKSINPIKEKNGGGQFLTIIMMRVK